jgi:hypothetical protein
MKRLLWLGFILFVVVSQPALVSAQGFPWDDFERRTIQELVKTNEREEGENIKQFPEQTQFVFRATTLPSAVQVSYTGESRPLSVERKKFIETWARSYYRNTGYANLYAAEFLFKEGSQDHWLPVQKDVAKYFADELKKGDPVDLYLISPGGLRVSNGKTLWLFLVEQFQQPSGNSR